MTTCAIPNCEEPPTHETTMWAYSDPGKIGEFKDLLIVSVPVCVAHKRENEACES